MRLPTPDTSLAIPMGTATTEDPMKKIPLIDLAISTIRTQVMIVNLHPLYKGGENG